ncbi:MAG TPA: hypothetical protein V6D18_05400 [Thermosynechococcaceae cyanobacterium]
MQTPQVDGVGAVEPSNQPIATYLGRQIFLKRVVVENVDRGVWIHWSHPQDQSSTVRLKYGHFVAPGQSLETALLSVYQTIEASIELELVNTALDHELIEPLAQRGLSPTSAKPWLHLAS